MLELQDLCCQRGERQLFSDVSWQLRAGEGVRILGANGSGKTTLLRIVAGLSRRFEGRITWCGRTLPRAASAMRANLLYFGHAPGIKSTLSPLENLQWWQSLHLSQAASIGQLETALIALGLEDCIDFPCYQLSAGQQRRAALARLLISPHRLWILDEPFSAIDKFGVELLEQFVVQQLARGGAVMLTTHQPLGCEGFSVLDLADYAKEPAVEDS